MTLSVVRNKHKECILIIMQIILVLEGMRFREMPLVHAVWLAAVFTILLFYFPPINQIFSLLVTVFSFIKNLSMQMTYEIFGN